MRKFHGTLALVVFALSGAALLRAQDGADQRKDQLEEEKRIELRRLAEFDQGYEFDYGGWIRFDYSNTEDKRGDTNQTNAVNLPGGEGEPTREQELSDLRLWAQFKIGEAHKFYIRSVSQYRSFHHGDGFGEPGDNKTFDTKEFNLDQGYYQLRLRPLIQGDKGGSTDWDVDMTAGRQFLRVGRGIVYNKVHNGILFNTKYKKWTLDAFVSRSPTSENDFDKSRPNAGETDREFWSGQLGWKGIAQHEVYAFSLIQRDHNRERPRSTIRDFTYDSEYWGIGAKGSLTFLPGKERYYAELIYQTGESIGRASVTEPTSTNRYPIRAWCLDAGLEVFIDVWGKPRPAVEYLYAQGDQDRRSLSSSTAGNERGTTDTEFIGFGFVQTGYAAAPRVSNLHMIRVGVPFRPFDDVNCRWIKDFETGPNVYWYWKDDANGPVSDSRARHNSRALGFETDWTIRWNILSDLAFSMNYGYFWPGAAYSTQSTGGNGAGANASDRHSLSVSFTYSF